MRGEQFGRTRVDRGHLALLLVGQRHDPEREHLVDLGAVEETARALGCNLGIVVEDDRRGEHRVVLSLLTDQDWPGADVAASRGGLAPAIGRIHEREERAVSNAEDGVGRDERAKQGLVPGRAACPVHRRTIDNAEPESEEPIGGLDRADLDGPFDSLLLAHQDADGRAVRPSHRLPPLPARER